jgi:tripartite-type tricarboxylate transporter receptor subunit TctC
VRLCGSAGLLGAAAALAVALPGTPAYPADAYPSRPARRIVPFGTGASTDLVARVFAQKFAEAWGQSVVVENRPGSGGVVGTEAAARAAPYGYTLLVYGINQTITPALYRKLPYDPLSDFALVSLYCTMPNILIVHPSVPARSVQELVAYARANPGRLRYVSSGIGASPHLTMELFKNVAKIDLLHVPYKIASQGYVDLASGKQLHAMFANLPGGLANSRAGRVRPLAVTSARRAEQMPEVPTMIESGIPEFEVTVWQGIAVPRATPKAAIDHIHASMMAVLNAPELKQRFFDQGVTAAPVSRAAFAAWAEQERARWAHVVKVSGTPVE